MRRRIADVLLLAFLLLLAFGVAHRAESVARKQRQITTDRVVFARYVKRLQGSFAKVVVRQRRASDLACARRRTHRYRVCIVVRGGQVVRTYEKKVVS